MPRAPSAGVRLRASGGATPTRTFPMQACFSAPATSRTGLSWLRRSGQWPCTAVVALLWTTPALAQDGTTRAAFRDDGALLVDG